MTSRANLPVAELWAAYVELRSVHKVGALYGVTGDTVHQHLRRAGFKLNAERWSKADIAELRNHYAAARGGPVDLTLISLKLGRSYAAVALRASRLGLAEKSRPVSEAERCLMGERSKAWHEVNEHPRGMLGKPQSQRARDAVSKASRERWERDKQHGTGLMSDGERQRRSDRMAARQAQSDSPLRRGFSRGSQGRRADLGGLHFRSSWEANYARYLTMLMREGRILRWEFEPDTFWFEKIRRGVRSYLPDFKVFPVDASDPYYVEVKGWMDAKSATKLKRMAKYYPHVRIEVVSKDAYKLIERRYSQLIPHWEKRKGDFEPCEKPEGGAKPPLPNGLAVAPDWLK